MHTSPRQRISCGLVPTSTISTLICYCISTCVRAIYFVLYLSTFKASTAEAHGSARCALATGKSPPTGLYGLWWGAVWCTGGI
jgi:hypothetical protein